MTDTASLPPAPNLRGQRKPWRDHGPQERATPEEEAVAPSAPAAPDRPGDNRDRLDRCRLHDFRALPGRRSIRTGQEQYRCARCGGRVPQVYAQAYRNGLLAGLRLSEARFIAYCDALHEPDGAANG